jgi:hypothetical protein
MQIDWGEFVVTRPDGTRERLYGFVAILGYSRLRFVRFVRRCTAPVLIRCLMAACHAFGGLPKALLTDRMKTVLVAMEDGQPKWHPLLSEFVSSVGITPRVCKPYTPQTKGKVERSIAVIQTGFWPGVRFTDLADLNRQVEQWVDGLNHREHATTHQRPVERWAEEPLRPLPEGWAWERFGSEDRIVSRDGFISYDGCLYGLPAVLQLTSKTVQVCEQDTVLQIWWQGQWQCAVPRTSGRRQVIPHPQQFTGVPTAFQARHPQTPIAHQVPDPVVAIRPLSEYDQLVGGKA